MDKLLSLSRAIDALNERIGQGVKWLVLLAVLVSAGNAICRYGLDMSSNAWLELQWYLFSLIFLFGAGYTLKHNGHVRIDVLHGHFSPRTKAWIDLFGSLFFLLPIAALIAWLSWPLFMNSFSIGEMSSDAGGLLRWPIKLAIPIGFTLLALQALSEAIKRAAFLRGEGTLEEEEPEEVV